VLLGCLSTAVGFITSCSEYFNRLCPGISYKIFVILNTVVSILLANKGLSAILQFSIPMLMMLYPLTIVIILLALTDKLFGGGRIV
ncbi:branched-chain amino acid transport system II carrier protein, partial [Neisseria sp. P0014.S006]|uniref:branched-chain amino acid transport system II carrier protein n=1 Tax=Neisseria sp. P0014.S006 TaxID=3436752 RepID=UPI003F81454A